MLVERGETSESTKTLTSCLRSLLGAQLKHDKLGVEVKFLHLIELIIKKQEVEQNTSFVLLKQMIEQSGEALTTDKL